MQQLLPVHPTLLHPLTGLPLRAIGLRPDGSPLWPILGGSGEGDDANDDAGKDNDSGADDSDKGDDDGDSQKSDDDGEKDWQAEYEAQQRINKKLERRTRRDQARIRELEGNDSGGGKQDGRKGAGKGGGDDGDQVDVDKAREEARAEARAEALTERVADKIEAKARKFADPEDAVAILLRTHDIEDFIDDGKVDVEEISGALADLAKNKPHLLAQGKKFEGDADGGARPSKSARPKTMGEAIARHYSGD